MSKRMTLLAICIALLAACTPHSNMKSDSMHKDMMMEEKGGMHKDTMMEEKGGMSDKGMMDDKGMTKDKEMMEKQ